MANQISPWLVAGHDPRRDDYIAVGRNDLHPRTAECGWLLRRHAPFSRGGVQDPELEPGILADHGVLWDHRESGTVKGSSDLHLFIDGADRHVVTFVGHQQHPGQADYGQDAPPGDRTSGRCARRHPTQDHSRIWTTCPILIECDRNPQAGE